MYGFKDSSLILVMFPIDLNRSIGNMGENFTGTKPFLMRENAGVMAARDILHIK